MIASCDDFDLIKKEASRWTVIDCDFLACLRVYLPEVMLPLTSVILMNGDLKDNLVLVF